jgi:tRNA-Thr(GGU) m(6)t(6)A37 methyltransferase TsaA
MVETTILMRPIGIVASARTEPIDDGWDAVGSRIVLDDAQFTPHALAGLDAFSHLEVLYHFDRVRDDEIERGARRPRGRADWPLVGIFAQRGKGRPNRLGSTICRLLRIEGLTLHVQGLDAIDGTPVLDIKPVMKGFLPRGAVREPDWSAELMETYW